MLLDMNKPPSDLAPKIVVRLPEGLRERISAQAKQNGRSVNAELVELLEQRYPELTPTPELVSKARRALDRIDKHPDREIGEEIRWSLVNLIEAAFEYGVLKGDTGYAEFEKRMEIEEADALRAKSRPRE